MKAAVGTAQRNRERGATLVEFAITGSVFLFAFFGVLDFGRLLWTHNALADAARQGARHAVSNSVGSTTEIRNVVVYGNPAGGASPIVTGLTTNNVEIVYDNVGLGRGTATIRITGYQFRFVTLFLAADLEMPDYQTTLTGETMGFAPPRI
ncbi:MAG: TadE family protein [Blastocatellia bacterium]|nr:TadE family protein [Blastocatellia bacterium]